MGISAEAASAQDGSAPMKLASTSRTSLASKVSGSQIGVTNNGNVTEESTATAATPAPEGQALIEMSRWRFWAIFSSILLTIFLFALDQLIIATAIPKITVEFHSLTQLPWLASGFL